ncbi:MAG TPA: hypothetical protein PK054_03540 [Anaerohalosphaeraceae bacterium]|nr:hypothetical protein [Anaerohalosphaeraceae bacterium]HOL89129.1 hypothetical protein [Anaerohalosphaeraceae bacterium]HPP55635.1 hypothetical protein [Anaerohalosphaeraceae bacterium]
MGLKRKTGFLSVLLGLALAGCTLTNRNSFSPAENKTLPCKDLLKAHAVTAFYLSAGKTYYTEQEHRFCPSLQILEISAEEPEGTVQWKWEKGTFNRPAGGEKTLSGEWQPESALAVFSGFLYGSGLLSVNLPPEQPTANLEGQVYTAIPLLASEGFEATLYKNQKTGIIDRVNIHNKKDNKTLMAILYNWRLLGKREILIPRKIDIFDITNGVSSKKLLIQIEYKEISASQ